MFEAVLVAHGSPAEPEPQEAAMQALAVRVAMWLPGWRVRGTTLAKDGALERALAAMTAPLVYPFFMAEGWFTGKALPKRLSAAGRSGLHQLPPFGVEADLPDLIARTLGPDLTRPVLLAAHGSKVSRTSANSTYAMADALQKRGYAQVRPGFVEEAPFLADVAREMACGVCLPFFALRAGHVAEDVPEALSQAGFDGALLPPIGEAPETARLIADSLHRAAIPHPLRGGPHHQGKGATPITG